VLAVDVGSPKPLGAVADSLAASIDIRSPSDTSAGEKCLWKASAGFWRPVAQ
jgi:hypothetical protein